MVRHWWAKVEDKQLLLASLFVLIVAQFLTWPHPLGSWMNRTGLLLEAAVVFNVAWWRWRKKS